MVILVKKQIELLKNSIETIKTPLVVNNTDLKNMLQLLVTIAVQRLDSAYVNILSQAKLTNLNAHIQSINNSLNAYINNQPIPKRPGVPSINQPSREQYLLNVMAYSDAALTILMQIPTLQQNEAEQAFDITISELKTESEVVINSLKDRNEKLTEQINEAFQRIEIMQKTMDDKKEQFNKLIETTHDKFQELENKRSKEFTEKTDKQFEEFKELKQKTEDIFELAGKSLTEKSQKIYADEAKKFAFWCFVIGIGWMALMFAVIFLPVIEKMWESSSENIDWVLIGYRAISGFILLLPSFYLLNESKKQRDIEQKYRELQIKLAAIEPYFLHIHDGISKDGQTIPDKDLVRLEIAKSLLSPSKEVGKDDIVVSKGSVSMIEKIIELVTTKIAK